jgi:hypothetical protein
MLNKRIGFLLPILLGLVITNCGGGEDVTLVPLTFEAPPTPYIQGDCNLTSDLDGWLQSAEFWTLEFASFLDNSTQKGRNEIYADVERIGQIVVVMSERPAPDCAESAQTLLLAAMMSTSNAFQEYINADRNDLTAIIEESRTRLGVATAAQSELKIRLESQYQNSASSTN